MLEGIQEGKASGPGLCFCDVVFLGFGGIIEGERAKNACGIQLLQTLTLTLIFLMALFILTIKNLRLSTSWS